MEQANDELVDGLVRCGYADRGRRGQVIVVRAQPSDATASLMRCVRGCLHALRDDCEALGQMACSGVVPEPLEECNRDCAQISCRDADAATASPCKPVVLRCGIGLEGLAPLSMNGMSSWSFACADGSASIAAPHVCDFVEDCPDGSDESAGLGCGRLSCIDAGDAADSE